MNNHSSRLPFRLLLLFLLFVQATSTSSTPEISYPPPRQYIYVQQPVLNTTVAGYNSMYFSITVPWSGSFQSQRFNRIWLCSDGTVYFRKPLDMYGRWDNKSEHSEAYLRIGSMGLTSRLLVIVTMTEIFVEFKGEDMTFNKYRLHWILTYRRPTNEMPEQFDIDVVENSLPTSFAVIHYETMERQLNIAKKGITSYSQLQLKVVGRYGKTIILGITAGLVGSVILSIVILCSILQCSKCRPWLDCCMECCSSGCRKWLASQSGVCNEMDSLPSSKSKSTSSSARSSATNNHRKDQDANMLCKICLCGNAQTSTSCHHNFHYKCLVKWYDQASGCPSCKRLVRTHRTVCFKCEQVSVIVKKQTQINLPVNPACEACRNSE